MKISSKFYLLVPIAILIFIVAIVLKRQQTPGSASNPQSVIWWNFQAIDTMKYSRDTAGAKLTDPTFDKTIDLQVSEIAATGATHVGIATPYDKEFLPFLKRWVAAARKYNLKVWFRGNFSGWEGWFNYPSIDRNNHLALTKKFILDNGDLFEDGDVFTACPECENGGPGDPRQTGDISGYRQFLIEEYQISRQAFQQIGKSVRVNFDSMNGDIAREIMDEATTTALGGIVTVDHYVASPTQLASDVQNFAQKSNGKIVLGEMGAPIPDIHGNMTPKQQADWLNTALDKLSRIPELEGISYWVNVGGSTQLWDDQGNASPAVAILTHYFKPSLITAQVVDDLGDPLKNVSINSNYKTTTTDKNGYFSLPVIGDEQITFTISGYDTLTLPLDQLTTRQITLKPLHPSPVFNVWRRIQHWIDNTL